MVVFRDSSGIAQGIQTAGIGLAKGLQARRQATELQKILNPQGNIGEDPAFQQKFLEKMGAYENLTGEKLTPEQLDLAWNSSLNQAQQQDGGGHSLQQVMAIAQRDPNLANVIQRGDIASKKFEQEERKMTQKGDIATQRLESKEKLTGQSLKSKEKMAVEARAYKSNEEFFTDIRKKRDSMPKREASLMSISGILAGTDERGLRNFAADYLGNKGYNADALRTSEANDLISAVKNEFIADTQSLPGGTRLNRYLEQLLRQALQDPLKTPANNLRITEMQRFLMNIDKKKIEISDKLLNQYEKAGREPPAHVARKVAEQIKPYEQQKMKELTKLYKDIDSGKIKAETVLSMDIAKDKIEGIKLDPGHTWMVFGKGIPKQVPTKDIARYQKKFGGMLIK